MDQSNPNQYSQPPQQGSPYEQPMQQTYQPPPPPPRPQKKFNWLACCGISCLVLLILGGVIGYGCYRMAAPFTEMVTAMTNVNQQVESTDIDTIKSASTTVSAAGLSGNLDTYQGQWVAVEGTVDSLSTSATFGNTSASSEGTTYVLEKNVIVIDITNTPHVAKPGESIRAYGQAVNWSMESMAEMPLIGGLMKKAMEEDPELKGAMGMVFFMAKKVELIAAPAGADGSTDSGSGSSSEDSGWIN